MTGPKFSPEWDSGTRAPEPGPAMLRERYRVERDRRLRDRSGRTYVSPTGPLAHHAADPNADPTFQRPPLRDEVDTLVVGGGFGGLLLAARLRERGDRRIRIVDRAADFGGTWYWNRYPGAQCDVESYVYLPLLEETGRLPSEKYCGGEEILEHARAIGRRFDLYRDACFQTVVTELRWDEEERRWTVLTDRGDVVLARYVAVATGPFREFRLPSIPDLATFRGRMFHTARWDYAYTGGGPSTPMTRLADKRVAVVGTGATAIQCVPPLGRDAGHLYVFQRTPAAVDSRGNRPTSKAWADSLTPGWQRRRQENFTAVVCGVDQEEDLVADGWTELFRSLRVPLPGLAPGGPGTEDEVAERMELEDFRRMNHLRARVERRVRDPATAEALKPWYRQFCKRPGFSDDYLATFNRPTVTLVDTRGRGVERATEHGLVSGGVEYAVDCVVLATGFSEGTPYEAGFGGWIRGRHGVRLSEHWREGVRTLHGFYSHGFPNCFFLGPSQNGMSINFSHSLDEQARHLAAVIEAAERSGAWYVEPTADAEAAWVAEVRRSGSMDQEYLLDCTPGSYNGEGMPVERPDTYGGNAVQFHEVIRRWRFTGGMTEVLRSPIRPVPTVRHD